MIDHRILGKDFHDTLQSAKYTQEKSSVNPWFMPNL